MVQVVAAILARNGKILIGQRMPEQSHPLKWEFPGGKVEPGETPHQAVVRELEEELAIRVTAAEELVRYEYTYPGKNPIDLIFFRITAFEGQPQNLIFRDLRWEPLDRLANFDFLEGDRPFLLCHTGLMHSIKLVEPAENEFLASLEAKSKKPNDFLRGMANRPEVLKAFIPLYGAIVGPGAVDRRIKSLVYLVCSYANECAFCIEANTPGARKAGLTEDEIQAIQTEQDQVFSEPERAVIQYARELTQTAAADDTRAGLLEHFNSEQVVEITLVAAMANFTNRFNNGLGIMPDART